MRSYLLAAAVTIIAVGLAAFICCRSLKTKHGARFPLTAMTLLVVLASWLGAEIFIAPSSPVELLVYGNGLNGTREIAFSVTGAGAGLTEAGDIDAECSGGWSLSRWTQSAQWRGSRELEEPDILLLRVPVGVRRWIRITTVPEGIQLIVRDGEDVRSISTWGDGSEMKLRLADSDAASLSAVWKLRFPVYVLFLLFGLLLEVYTVKKIAGGGLASTQGKRNGAADFYRVVFSVMIVVYHACSSVAHKGYLSVEFFFILGGWLLMAHYESSRRRGKASVAEYFRGRCLRIYPYYLMRGMIGLVFCLLAGMGTLTEIIGRNFGDILMLQSAGVPSPAQLFDGVMWYISAMMLSGLAVYMLLSIDAQKIHGVAPFLAALILGSLIMQNSNIDLTIETGFGGIMTMGFWRGFAETLLGCTLFAWTKSFRTEKKTPQFRAWASVWEALLLLVILWCMLEWKKTRAEVLPVLCIGLLVTSAMSCDSYLTSLLTNRLSLLLGRITLSVYLVHALVWSWVDRAWPELADAPRTALIVLGSFALAAILTAAVDAGSELIRRFKLVKRGDRS